MLHIWDVFAFGMFGKTIFGDKPKSKTPKEKVNQPQKHNPATSQKISAEE